MFHVLNFNLFFFLFFVTIVQGLSSNGLGVDPLSPLISAKLASSPPSPSSINTDSFVYLSNGVVFLGVDISRGASIGAFGPRKNDTNITISNYINIHDFGRETQVSYYTGPVPYNPPGCNQPPSYSGFPYNPIGAGDYFGNAARILSVNVSSDNTSAVITSIPQQWACDDVAAEATLVKTITLVGNVAEVNAKLTLHRPDLSLYPPFQQELPAVYVTGSLCALWAYTGDAPYTNDTATQIVPPDPQHGLMLRVPEQWLAYLLPDNSAGLGVWHPSSTVFAAMRWNSSFEGCVGGPYDDVTGYISARYNEILDYNIEYVYNYSLIWGSVEEIRAYATSQNEKGLSTPGPTFDFSIDRQHFTTNNCISMLPSSSSIGAVQLLMTENDPNFISGYMWWKAESVPVLYITAAYGTIQHDTQAQLFYVNATMENGFDADHVVNFDVVADGEYHTYQVQLEGVAFEYTGVMVQLRLDPVISGMEGSWVNISRISSIPPPFSPSSPSSPLQKKGQGYEEGGMGDEVPR